MAKNSYFYALGRRKTATARIRLTNGKGKIMVNETPANEYFAESKYLLRKLQEPFVALDQVDKYDISAHVNGGGHEGQIEAIRLGIAKALATMNEDLKTTLKRADLLSRDPRAQEVRTQGRTQTTPVH
jgi:small subunit ribosomal protein S9